jgi:Tle cognate immunity protein 4 C-terminal domain
MRTHCVGRYLINLPEAFEQTPGSDVEFIYGLDKDFQKINVKVARATNDQPTFNEIVAKRTASLAGSWHRKAPSKSMLAAEQKVREDVVLVRAYRDSSLLNVFQSELYALFGSAVGLFSTRVFSTENPEEREAALLKVVDRSRFVSTPDQAGRGACLGPLVIDAAQDGEIFSVSFRAKAHPDLVLSINMNSLVAESDGGLLKRWDSKSGMLSKLNFKSSVLRRGRVVIAGRPGEELLDKGKEQDKIVREFTAEVLRPSSATFAAPSFAISMSMGGQVASGDYVDATWSDAQAMAVWDAVIKSIRLRPGAV